MKKSNLMTHTAIMTAVNLVMRTIGVWFNSYLTSRIGASGMGLFQLIMTVYSLAVTFSCAGIRLATTRLSVEIRTLKKNDPDKSLTFCITYAGICGSIVGFILFFFSNIIGISILENSATAFPLKILSVSLPFVAMSSALGGYFTSCEMTPHYSVIQMIEQGVKIAIVTYLIGNSSYYDSSYLCISIVIGMTSSEIVSCVLSSILKNTVIKKEKTKNKINILDFLRIALPDAAGTCIRSILLTVEHILIPKGFRKSGINSQNALASYGVIHGMAMPLILYPSAFMSSLSVLLIPKLASFYELSDCKNIRNTVMRNLKRTLLFSAVCSLFFYLSSPFLSELIYKTNEAAKYIRILSPLVPIMYTDMITDGMLKGLDGQVYSMKYNIIDSAICVILVYFLIPKYSVNGYIFILYISELLNFVLSISRLFRICGIRCFQAREEGISRLFRLKRYSNAPSEYGYRTYRVRAKRSQDL